VIQQVLTVLGAENKMNDVEGEGLGHENILRNTSGNAKAIPVGDRGGPMARLCCVWFRVPSPRKRGPGWYWRGPTARQMGF
jgi:hypothetical protein